MFFPSKYWVYDNNKIDKFKEKRKKSSIIVKLSFTATVNKTKIHIAMVTNCIVDLHTHTHIRAVEVDTCISCETSLNTNNWTHSLCHTHHGDGRQRVKLRKMKDRNDSEQIMQIRFLCNKPLDISNKITVK